MIIISLCDSYTSCSWITLGWLTACRIISISVMISSLQLTARLRFLRNLAAYTHPVLLSVHFLTTANLPLCKPTYQYFTTIHYDNQLCGFDITGLASSLTCLILLQSRSSLRLDLFWWVSPLLYKMIAASCVPRADKRLDYSKLPTLR